MVHRHVATRHVEHDSRFQTSPPGSSSVSFTPRLNFRETFVRFFSSAEEEENQKLLAAEAGTSNDGFQPSSDFEIRNRYLSRIGAPVSDSIED